MLARLSRPRPRPFVALIAALAIAAAILLMFGRPLLCSCGSIELWGEVGPKQSQMLADWYSPSHIVHGFLFYGLLHLVARSLPVKPGLPAETSLPAEPGWPVERRFVIALAIEAAWEIFENTPMVINRYREATIALGYSGDSILNSLSDISVMALGFWAARRLPVWVSVTVVLLLELIPLLAIRDNLTLNIWMLLAPSDAIRIWQAG